MSLSPIAVHISWSGSNDLLIPELQMSQSSWRPRFFQGIETFDVLRLTVFNGNGFKIDFERTPSPQSTQENTKKIFSITVVDTSPV